MFKLLFILYIVKLHAQINICKHSKRKHGQDVIRNVRLHEKLKTKYMKINADIKYIKFCESQFGAKLKKESSKISKGSGITK